MTRTPQAALYGRISDDPTDVHAGVTRQLEDGEAVAKRRDLPVYDTYRDDSISALTGKFRPGYDRLMRDAEAGLFTAIIVYHFSRLWRNRIERAQGIERLRRAGVSVISVKGPELDLSTAAGRGMAGLLREFDSMESEVKGERVTRAALQRAENGDPNGSVSYGWTREYVLNDKGKAIGVVGDVHHPDEAPVVAEVCHRLLKGESVTGVTRWLNEAGIPSPGAGHTLKRGHGILNPDGSRWSKHSARVLALRPANAGLRLYHAGRPDERLLDAKVQPIVTRDEWERLRAMLAQQTRKNSRPGKRRHLLTYGVGECGVCGSVLGVSERGGVARYICVGTGGCTSRVQDKVDQHVVNRVVLRLAATDARDLLVDNSAADAAMNHAEALRARLSAAADQYADGLIDGNQLARISAKLRPQVEQAERDAAQAAPDVPLALLADVAGEQAAEKFEGLSVPQQRTLVEYLIDRVVLLRAKRGPGFDPATVQVVWRGTPQAA